MLSYCLYFYGNDKPLHVSHGDAHNRAIVLMLPGKSGRLVPKVVTAERFCDQRKNV
jgi:hypothetical protein